MKTKHEEQFLPTKQAEELGRYYNNKENQKKRCIQIHLPGTCIHLLNYMQKKSDENCFFFDGNLLTRF